MTTSEMQHLTFSEGLALVTELVELAPSGVTVSLAVDPGDHDARIHLRGPTGHHSVCLCHSNRERVLAHADGFFEATRARAARLLGATLAEVA